VGYPSSSTYKLGDLSTLFPTIKWYFFRTLNIPESIKNFPFETMILSFINILNFLILIFGVIVFNFSKIVFHRKIISLGILIYIIWSLPFYFLPNHLYSYQLQLALIGFYIVLAPFIEILLSKRNFLINLYIYFVFFIYFLSSFINSEYLFQSHWTVNRAYISNKYLNEIKSKYPNIEGNSVITFLSPDKTADEISFSLSQEKALQLLYKNKNITVNYINQTLVPFTQYKIITQ
jgi:hypothetical protein